MGKFRLIISSLMLLCFFHPANSKKKKDYDCIQMDQCQCMFGQRGLGFNLNGLNLTVEDIVHGNFDVVRFHPCTDITIGKQYLKNRTVVLNQCDKGTSLCLIQTADDDKHSLDLLNLGNADSFEFQTNIDGTETNFVSHYNSWTTTIKLQCKPEAKTDELIISGLDWTTKKLDMVLQSQKSCLTSHFESIKLGLWTVILIVICTVILVYFIGGAFLKSFLFGAQGQEMIPHYSFWNAAPSRLMSCLGYCTKCCQTSSGYDRI